jgi:hypothetical protein
VDAAGRRARPAQRSKTRDDAHSVAWFVFHPVATFRERAR